jgi:hypothetical protein
MKCLMTVRTRHWHVLLCMAVLAWPSEARSQGSVGAGPLTSKLAETEPTSGAISLGPVTMAPGVVIPEIGWDSNVFDEAVDPKEDYLVSIAPDVALFARTRFIKMSLYGGMDFQYYRTFESERSNGYAARGRVDFLLSRLRPFVAGGQTKTRTRPNGEIETRADMQVSELSGGLALDLSPHSVVYVASYRATSLFLDAFQSGVELGVALDRESFNYEAGLRTDLTPLTSITLYGGYLEDRFQQSPSRDSDNWLAGATLRFAAEAVVTGQITVDFLDFKPVDPSIQDFSGFVGSAGLIYPVREFGRFNFVASRDLEYSFDEAEGYYLENRFDVSYTQRLFGDVDAQVLGSRSVFNFGYRDGSQVRQDSLDLASAGVGYNLKNRSRVSLNYEYSRRRSPLYVERNYEKRRIFAAWTAAIR